MRPNQLGCFPPRRAGERLWNTFVAASSAPAGGRSAHSGGKGQDQSDQLWLLRKERFRTLRTVPDFWAPGYDLVEMEWNQRT